MTLSAPIRRPRLYPLLPHHNNRTSPPTLSALSSIDPQPLLPIHRVRSPTVSYVSHYPTPRAIGHICLHIPLGHIHHLLHFTMSNRTHRTKRIHLCSKRNLALINIPQSRQHPLIQQHYRYFCFRIFFCICRQSCHPAIHREFV